MGWDIDKEILGRIRADRRVEAVECDSMPWINDPAVADSRMDRKIGK